ncbi:GM24529 [Drosophila sechellia]|uniref:GM24529 n=1 Tax=Drosophila sechellia TaxID=7238 RepID=B4HHT4_DROSE|nr:GM24529 [Drosophila sechellia]
MHLHNPSPTQALSPNFKSLADFFIDAHTPNVEDSKTTAPQFARLDLETESDASVLSDPEVDQTFSSTASTHSSDMYIEIEG